MHKEHCRVQFHNSLLAEMSVVMNIEFIIVRHHGTLHETGELTANGYQYIIDVIDTRISLARRV